MLRSKISGRWNSKILLMLALLFMLGLVSSTVAASQSDMAQTAVVHEHHDGEIASNQEPPKWQLMHYDRNGNPTGHLHGLTIDEYYAVLDAVLTAGGDPSPQNMDRMYDQMFGRGR